MPDGAWPILSFSAKWEVGGLEDLGSRPVCPAPVSKAVAERLTTVAREAWTAVGGSGYGRVDMRLDEAGQPWILEVNPNPDIADDAGLSRMAKAAGWSYEDLILRIVDAALSHARETRSVDLLARGARSRTDRRSTGQQPRLA
jgi:D-alanine-D-alanine ligase